MKICYIECRMGAAGDMLMSALSELLPDPDRFIDKMNSLGLDGVSLARESASSCGIGGTRISVSVDGREEESHDVHHHDHEHDHEHGHHHEHHHDHEHGHHHEHHHDHHHDHEHDHHEHHHEHLHHHHSSMADIEHIISHLNVSEGVKKNAAAVYRLIAEAESKAHGRPVSEIHFHEVGTKDAVADIVGVCMLMEEIGADKVIASPVHVGSGQVRCAHGILPVPAPATAHILRDVPIYSGNIEGELCTPTGAALLKHFASDFGAMPAMKVSAVGYGIGKKEFPAANCVRVFLGKAESQSERISELKCNLDDMTPEQIAFAMERIFEAGALDVFTAPIGMKKNRPAVLLTVLCREQQRDEILRTVFKHTSTIGIRESLCERYTLGRREAEIETKYGRIGVKEVSGYGVSRMKPEYEDIAEIARNNNISIDDVLKEIGK